MNGRTLTDLAELTGLTGLTAALRTRLGRIRAARESGLSLIELVVAMSIMSTFMVMFTVSTQQMFDTATSSEARSVAQSQLNNMFLRLDKEIRYAAAVSTPGTIGDNAYVEFLTTNTGTRTCTELRLDRGAQQLQRRTWTQGAEPLSPGPWMPLASDVTAAQPFTTVTGGTFAFQRLRLQLTASSGGATGTKAAQLDITFTAWNTALNTSSDTVCTEGRSIP